MRDLLFAASLVAITAGSVSAQESPSAPAEAPQASSDAAKVEGCACCKNMAMNKPTEGMQMPTEPSRN